MSISIRQFQNGDEKTLALFFKNSYGKYNGAVDYDEQSWYRRFVENPFIGPERILIGYDHQKRILGYLAWGKGAHPFFSDDIDGIIFDFYIDERKNCTQTANNLLHYFVNLSYTLNMQKIQAVCLPSKKVRVILEKNGFMLRQKGFNLVLTPLNISFYIKQRFEQLKINKEFSLRFQLTKDFGGSVVQIGSGNVIDFCVGNSDLQTITVSSTFTSLSDIIVGEIQPQKAIHSKLVSIAPADKIKTALEFLNTIAIKKKWCIPYIDWR